MTPSWNSRKPIMASKPALACVGVGSAVVARMRSSDQRKRSSWASASKPSRSAMTMSGSGAATSHTKSHEPTALTRSTMPRHRAATLGSISAMRRGVNPRLTRPRRALCSGSSMEIIIGRCMPCGRGARKLEKVTGSFSMARTSSCFEMPQTSAVSS